MLTARKVTSAATALIFATTAGCSRDEPSSWKQPTTTATTPTQVAPPTRPKHEDAGQIITALQGAKLGLTRVAVQDEDTDPNNLLGRPNGYVSRASADLPGGDTSADKYDVARGLVVEVFADADGAKDRADYIATIQKGSPVLGSEWQYITPGGTGLVRVGGKVKPSLAKKVEAAVAKL
jgi:hypothetical protein